MSGNDSNLTSSKPGHTTGGSGRGGARWGAGAGRGGAGRDADGSVRPGDSRPSCFRGSKTNVPNVSPEARTNEILCKPVEEHNERLTRGTTAARCSWLLTSGPALMCLCKSFLCKACRGNEENSGLLGSSQKRRAAVVGGSNARYVRNYRIFLFLKNTERTMRLSGDQSGRKSGRDPAVKNRLTTSRHSVGDNTKSVRIVLRLFVLPTRRSERFSSLPWDARRKVLSGAFFEAYGLAVKLIFAVARASKLEAVGRTMGALFAAPP